MSGETGELWYVQHGRSEAIGPVETDLLLKGIASGRVPLAARICPVGGATWTLVATHPRFASAVRELAPPPPIAAGAAQDDLDFGDDVKTLVAQSPLDVFSGRNHKPPPPPPLAPLQPPAAGWAPQLPPVPVVPTLAMWGPGHSAGWSTPTSPGKRQYTRALIIFGVTAGLGLLLLLGALAFLLKRP